MLSDAQTMKLILHTCMSIAAALAVHSTGQRHLTYTTVNMASPRGYRIKQIRKILQLQLQAISSSLQIRWYAKRPCGPPGRNTVFRNRERIQLERSLACFAALPNLVNELHALRLLSLSCSHQHSNASSSFCLTVWYDGIQKRHRIQGL